MILRSRITRAGVGVFIALNLATVLFMNRPAWVTQAINRALAASHSSIIGQWERGGEWLIAQYAHAVGLDNRWQMFSHNSRFNWWYVIEGRYADGAIVVLPLPRQSRRTFWQWALFDFKVAKFHLNLYTDPAAREAYAHYLCRHYPLHANAPIQAIVWELHHQMIRDPMEAAAQGSHLEPHSYGQLLHDFQCP